MPKQKISSRDLIARGRPLVAVRVVKRLREKFPWG
jgi:hypothetical protein